MSELEVIRTIQFRGRDIQVLRASEVARLLGVSRQRVYQLMDRYEGNFPLPVAKIADGAVWDRRAVEVWAKSWDRRWDVYRGRPTALNPGELLITVVGGEQRKVGRGAMVVPLVSGVQLRDEFMPWEDIVQIRRMPRANEPWQFAVQLCSYGVEVRAQFSVALYPRLDDIPEQVRADAERVLKEGKKHRSWIFRTQK